MLKAAMKELKITKNPRDRRHIMSSFFYIQPELKNDKNASFLNSAEAYANEHQLQLYAIKNPLGENKYNYQRDNACVILSPGMKIAFLDFGGDEGEFNDYIEDFVEDLGSLSDKYNYKDTIGRPREWRKKNNSRTSFY